MTRRHLPRFRSRVLAVALVATALTAGLTAPLSAQAAPAPALVTATPFTAATATDNADGTSTVIWAGAGSPVRVLQVDGPAGTTGPQVGQGGADGTVQVSGLPAAAPGARRYFRLVTDAGAALVVTDRSLHLPGAKNARDVGGYRTTDGHWVRSGVAFRSGEPSGLTTAEWSALTGLGVNHYVDLRTSSERQSAAYTPPAGATYQVADVIALPPNALPGVTDVLSTLHCANPVVVLNILRSLLTVTDPEDALTGSTYPLESCYYGSLKALGDLEKSLAGPRTVLYHCTAGKDRTGVGTAILLSILGVPRETVIQDFLLSNVYRGPGSVQREWIEGWFNAVDGSWGSFATFVRQGLQLDDATVARLKQKFLVDPSAPPA